MRRTTSLPTAILTLIALSLSACDNGNQIQVYEAPKGPRAVSGDQRPGQSPSQGRPTQQTQMTAGAPIDWTLPEGWSAQPGSSMRFATIMIPSDDGPPVEIRVTPLGLAAADLKPNVDRWAGQIGLDPIPADQLDTVVTAMQIGGNDAYLVNLVNEAEGDRPAMQILSAIAPAPSDNRVWFIMIIDEKQRVAPHVDQFKQLLESVTFPGSQPPQQQAQAEAPAAPPASSGSDMDASPFQPAQGDDVGITYQKPEAWQEDPAASDMRAASFILKGEYDDGEVSVTHFPGNVGGLMANINRWRGQVNLPPVSDLREQEFSRVQIDGHEGLAVDLIEPDMEDFQDEALRVIVFIIPDVGGETWFFKMSGTYDVVEKNRDAFAAFCHSVKFKGADSSA